MSVKLPNKCVFLAAGFIVQRHSEFFGSVTVNVSSQTLGCMLLKTLLKLVEHF